MIQEYAKFTCNNCEKEELILKAVGYPYDKGWRHIDNLLGKVTRVQGPPGHFEIKNVDLCCNDCESQYLIKQMCEAKQELPPAAGGIIVEKQKDKSAPKPKEEKENPIDQALSEMERLE